MQKIQITTKDVQYDSLIINAIKANDERTLKAIYTANYSKVEALVLKNKGTTDHAKDIYQEAFLAVWRNIKRDKFQPQNETSIHGYLYSIAKNKWMDFLRSKEYKKTIVVNKEVYSDNSELVSDKLHDDKSYEERLHITMNAFKNLERPCKKLLTKFYFEKMSMNDIAAELQIGAASTRNKKYRCMQKLKELALKIK